MSTETDTRPDTAAADKPAGGPPASVRNLLANKPDIDEHGSPIDGEPQTMTQRLFMQLQAYGDCEDAGSVVRAVESAQLPAVVYEDVNDPRGVAVLTWSAEPAHFVGPFRQLLRGEPFRSLTHRPQYTMFGRTYSLGYERSLQEWLFDKPIGNATNPDWPWAIWYPLRRSGRFMQLEEAEQRKILMEHGHIGMAFGAADFAHDIRLACQGLDAADNDFVIGLTGKELYPLSAIVQAMRKTTQTSQYLEKLGPFLVARAIYQSTGA